MIDYAKIEIAKGLGWTISSYNQSVIQYVVKIGNFTLSHDEMITNFYPNNTDIEMRLITRNIISDLVSQIMIRYDTQDLSRHSY